jgi:hypothetical protein
MTRGLTKISSKGKRGVSKATLGQRQTHAGAVLRWGWEDTGPFVGDQRQSIEPSGKWSGEGRKTSERERSGERDLRKKEER